MGIRTREGLPPTRFPSLLTCIRTRSAEYVTGITRRGNSWRALPAIPRPVGSTSDHLRSRLTRSGGGGSSSTPWTGGGGSTPRRGRSRSFATSKRGGRTGLGRRNEEGDVTCGPVDDLRRS
jgi:hypothetical protein